MYSSPSTFIQALRARGITPTLSSSTITFAGLYGETLSPSDSAWLAANLASLLTYLANSNTSVEWASVTAAGTTQGTATALTAPNNVVTTPGNTGVELPSGTSGAVIAIWNLGPGTLSVYPASGQQIRGLAANAPDLIYQPGASNASQSVGNYTIQVPATNSKTYTWSGSAWF